MAFFFNAQDGISLVAYSDADYMQGTEKQDDQQAVFFMLGSGSSAWCSQRQKCVALSTTESEYIAASEAVKELVWIKRLLSDLLMKKSFVPKMCTWTIKARSDLLKMLSSTNVQST